MLCTTLQVIIRNEEDDSEKILTQCMNFCFRCVNVGCLSHMRSVLLFIHLANKNDFWLLSSASVVLPSLFRLFSEILFKVDPALDIGRKETVTPITPKVKDNCNALRTLSVILNLSVDLSDTQAPDIEEQLEKFVRASAAILFDSDFSVRKCGEKLNAVAYAMDELVRHASFALSNILLSYTNLLPDLEGFLIDRLDSLFDFFGSAAELSVQRSLIIVLKVMYDNETAVKPKARLLIERKFNNSEEWSQDVLSLFKDFKVSDGIDVVAKDELMIKLSMKNYLCPKSFTTTGCKVQVKGLMQKRRSTFKTASVDWNLTSIVTHFGSDASLFWPLYTLGTVEWRRSKCDLHVKFDDWEDETGAEIVIRFNGAEENVKSEIYDRLQESLTKTIANLYSSFNPLNSQEKSLARTHSVVTGEGIESIEKRNNVSLGSASGDEKGDDHTKEKFCTKIFELGGFDYGDVEESDSRFDQLETVEPEHVFPEIENCFGSGKKTEANCEEEKGIESSIERGKCVGNVKRNTVGFYCGQDKGSFRKEPSNDLDISAVGFNRTREDVMHDDGEVELNEYNFFPNPFDGEVGQIEIEEESTGGNESSESEHDLDATYSPENGVAKVNNNDVQRLAKKTKRKCHNGEKGGECNETPIDIMETEIADESKAMGFKQRVKTRATKRPGDGESGVDSGKGHASDVEMDAEDIGEISAAETDGSSDVQAEDEFEDGREPEEHTDLLKYRENYESSGDSDVTSSGDGNVTSSDEEVDLIEAFQASEGKRSIATKEQSNPKDDVVNDGNGELLLEYDELVEMLEKLMTGLNQVCHNCSLTNFIFTCTLQEH